MNYCFETDTTMKAYNRKKWWIDSDIIRPVYIESESLKKAVEEYAEIVNNKYFIEISKTAIKRKNPMYIDTENGAKQIGYVITGKCDFDNDGCGWVSQYIDLWVTITTIGDAF